MLHFLLPFLLTAEADAAMINGNRTVFSRRDIISLNRGGRRGDDQWTPTAIIDPMQAVQLTAEADAAMINGHGGYSCLRFAVYATAEADAAMINGHCCGFIHYCRHH